jgi:uncharacterized repeat protein (TIGR03803 family)
MDFKIRSCRLAATSMLLAFFCASALHAQTNFAQLYSFGYPSLSGFLPLAAPVIGSDGAVYGTTYRGGTNDQGTIYQFSLNSATYTVLHHFTGGADGSRPIAALVESTNDGFLYGTTFGYVGTNPGTVFKLAKSGNNYTVLHVFTGTNGDGANPRAELLQASDGLLYGTTYAGGSSNLGTVFKLDTNGNNFAVLASFTLTNGVNGRQPYAGLVEGTNGMLYGLTFTGGYQTSNTYNAAFAISKDGLTFTPLVILSTTNSFGINPCASLLPASDGLLYGTMRRGGTNNAGTLFSLSQDGTVYNALTNFSTNTGVNWPQGRLLEGGDGALYGTSFGGGTNGLGAVFKINKDGSGLTVLHSFTNGLTDGAGPQSGLALATNGTLYGTTFNGGVNNYGVLYSLGQDGSNFSVLWQFLPGGGDGTYPNYTAPATNNVIYGTTEAGGAYDLGTVFKYDQNSSAYAVLHSFSGGTDDGQYPAAVLRASDGRLYGTTSQGGLTNMGVIYSLDTNGNNYAVLHNLGGTNVLGSRDVADLIESRDGYLYGVTYNDGRGGPYYYNGGTIYKIDKGGTNFQVVVLFMTNSVLASNLYSGLLLGSDGLIYGTAEYGGTGRYGVVYRVNPNGTGYTNLYNFTEPPGGVDGNLHSALAEGSDGTLYGVINGGSITTNGLFYKLNKDGSGYTNLYLFTGVNNDGSNPWGRPVQGADSAFYGITQYGGLNGLATLYRIRYNGSGYGVSNYFNPFDGPQAGLSRGAGGFLFGTTIGQGGMGLGSIFQMTTPVYTLNFAGVGPGGLLSLAGTSNQTYQIFAATNLTPPVVWRAIGTNMLDATGASQFVDTNAAGNNTRYYKAVIP